MHELPNKAWSASRLDKLIEKINDTGGANRTNGSCRLKSLNPKIGHQTTLTEPCGLHHFGTFDIKRLKICNT